MILIGVLALFGACELFNIHEEEQQRLKAEAAAKVISDQKAKEWAAAEIEKMTYHPPRQNYFDDLAEKPKEKSLYETVKEADDKRREQQRADEMLETMKEANRIAQINSFNKGITDQRILDNQSSALSQQKMTDEEWRRWRQSHDFDRR